ncbi:YciI family protein [Actinomycetospora endophytica]|uniref:YciI family protein n=1 Tax=Actinomycetospora endophytica TaxID=2291215 RepID=A0ABS8PE97_9PSEU|nr:YciI family protein [Actinomycetospora endophytica]MCD2196587.1 YciI family protein [Actinomycetospora endophytica]
MRFLMTTGENSRQPDEALFAEMGAFIEEMAASGRLVVTGGLGPDPRRMESLGDEITVTDGPFTETKEAILGFAIMDCDSWDEALEIARRFRAIVGDGQSTIHQVFGPDE